MKKVFIQVLIALVLVLTGCSSKSSDRIFLTTDFQKDVPLKYKFTSERFSTINWQEDSNSPKSSANPTKDTYNEKSELIVSYKPIEINPFGLAVIEANIISATIQRNLDRGTFTDAFKNFQGKSFKFTVNPNGKIEDTNELAALIKEVGQTAFRKSNSSSRIKEPDMIADFIATQWFLWDSVSSIPNPSKGIRLGQKWNSFLSVPATMIFRKLRDVEYTLSEIKDSPNGKIAVIKSKFTSSENTTKQWPAPYEGSFNMSGKFGFLGGYNVLDIEGQGQEFYNIDKGLIQGYTHQYQMNLTARPPFGISMTVKVNVQQKLTMEFIE